MRHIILIILTSSFYIRSKRFIKTSIAVFLYFIGVRPYMAIMCSSGHPYGGDIICCGYWKEKNPDYYDGVVFNLPEYIARKYQEMTYKLENKY